MQSNLIARETTYELFIQKLAEGKTNGIDITILAICELFDISIIVLFEKYLWKSDEIPINDFDICLIVFSKGKYMLASRRDNTKVEVEYPESLATTMQCLKLSQWECRQEPVRKMQLAVVVSAKLEMYVQNLVTIIILQTLKIMISLMALTAHVY